MSDDFFTQPYAQQMCIDADIDIAKVRSNLLTFQELEKFLEQSIKEVSKDISSYQWLRTGEVLAVGIKHICDKTLLAASLLPGGSGVVGFLYDQAQVVVKATTDGLEASDIAHTTADKWVAVAQYGAKNAGKATAAKVWGAIGTAKSIYNMTNELTSWWEKSGKHAKGDAGIRSARRSLKNQLADMRAKIKKNQILLYHLEQMAQDQYATQQFSSSLHPSTEGPACKPPTRQFVRALESHP